MKHLVQALLNGTFDWCLAVWWSIASPLTHIFLFCEHEGNVFGLQEVLEWVSGGWEYGVPVAEGDILKSEGCGHVL